MEMRTGMGMRIGIRKGMEIAMGFGVGPEADYDTGMQCGDIRRAMGVYAIFLGMVEGV